MYTTIYNLYYIIHNLLYTKVYQVCQVCIVCQVNQENKVYQVYQVYQVVQIRHVNYIWSMTYNTLYIIYDIWYKQMLYQDFILVMSMIYDV